MTDFYYTVPLEENNTKLLYTHYVGKPVGFVSKRIHSYSIGIKIDVNKIVIKNYDCNISTFSCWYVSTPKEIKQFNLYYNLNKI